MALFYVFINFINIWLKTADFSSASAFLCYGDPGKLHCILMRMGGKTANLVLELLFKNFDFTESLKRSQASPTGSQSILGK